MTKSKYPHKYITILSVLTLRSGNSTNHLSCTYPTHAIYQYPILSHHGFLILETLMSNQVKQQFVTIVRLLSVY